MTTALIFSNGRKGELGTGVSVPSDAITMPTTAGPFSMASYRNLPEGATMSEESPVFVAQPQISLCTSVSVPLFTTYVIV